MPLGLKPKQDDPMYTFMYLFYKYLLSNYYVLKKSSE